MNGKNVKVNNEEKDKFCRTGHINVKNFKGFWSIGG